MKKTVFVSLFLLLCMQVLPVYAQENIKIVVDDKNVLFTDVKPFTDENSRTQIPLKAVSDVMGYGVGWDGVSESAYVFSVEDGGRKLTSLCFAIGKNEVEKQVVYGNGFFVSDSLEELTEKMTDGEKPETIIIDTAPIIKNSRTFVPVKYVTELFGHEVKWNENTSTVNIMMK